MDRVEMQGVRQGSRAADAFRVRAAFERGKI